jgi:hypothetical protein
MDNIVTKDYAKPDDLQFVLNGIQQFSLPSSYFGVNRAFVYGGYVRDKYRGQPFTDMDIHVSCIDVAEKFIEWLEQSNRIITLERRTHTETDIPKVDYQSFSMVIQTPRTAELKIDICYSNALVLQDKSLNTCDFTMNNLMLDIDGNLSTRIKAFKIGMHKKYSEAEWLSRCIQDCIRGELVWMIPDRFTKSLSTNMKNSFMEKMNMRLEKMLSKGFVLTGEHLTNFRILKLRPVSSLSTDCEATICAVCLEDYSETSDKPTAVSKCSHHFHTVCIQKWITKQRQEGSTEPKCPCCRTEIELYY